VRQVLIRLIFRSPEVHIIIERTLWISRCEGHQPELYEIPSAEKTLIQHRFASKVGGVQGMNRHQKVFLTLKLNSKVQCKFEAASYRIPDVSGVRQRDIWKEEKNRGKSHVRIEKPVVDTGPPVHFRATVLYRDHDCSTCPMCASTISCVLHTTAQLPRKVILIMSIVLLLKLGAN